MGETRVDLQHLLEDLRGIGFDSGFLAHVIRHHFEPLLDPAFQPILMQHYSRRIAFRIDSEPCWSQRRRRTM